MFRRMKLMQLVVAAEQSPRRSRWARPGVKDHKLNVLEREWNIKLQQLADSEAVAHTPAELDAASPTSVISWRTCKRIGKEKRQAGTMDSKQHAANAHCFSPWQQPAPRTLSEHTNAAKLYAYIEKPSRQQARTF